MSGIDISRLSEKTQEQMIEIGAGQSTDEVITRLVEAEYRRIFALSSSQIQPSVDPRRLAYEREDFKEWVHPFMRYNWKLAAAYNILYHSEKHYSCISYSHWALLFRDRNYKEVTDRYEYDSIPFDIPIKRARLLYFNAVDNLDFIFYHFATVFPGICPNAKEQKKFGIDGEGKGQGWEEEGVEAVTL